MRRSSVKKRRFTTRRPARGLKSPRQVIPDVTPGFIRDVIVKGFFFVLILLFTALLNANVFAQTSKGFVVATIVDSNAAVIVGATVKTTNTSTGITRNTVSANDGTFRLDAVDPGTYKIEQ